MRKTIAPFSMMAIAGYLLTLLTLFWGAPFIRVLRQRFGFVAFWLTGILLSASAYELWFFVAAVWITVGVYTELEAKGVRWIWNGIGSIVLGVLVLVGGAAQVLNSKGITTVPQLADVLKTFFKERTVLQIPVDFDFVTLVQQIPSIAFIAIVLTLAHALIFEKTIHRWFRIPRERFAAEIKLLDFKLPDVFVWIGMVSFLGAVLEWKGQNFSINVLNVCIVLFFLQGLAILEYFFKVLKVGIFVRALGYFLFVFQLFVVLAFLGFVDFWLDFRKRLRKLPAKGQDNPNARLL